MNADDRVSFYADRTGLSKAAVNRYRRNPSSKWTTTADRRQAGAIRGLERMADDPELPWAEWRRAATDILREIAAFVRGVLTTVADFVERLGKAIEGVLERLAHVLSLAFSIGLFLA